MARPCTANKVFPRILDIARASRQFLTRTIRYLAAEAGIRQFLDVGVVAGEAYEEAQEDYSQSGAVPYVLRTPEEIASFFDGLELVEPGVVSCPRWRPGPTPSGPLAEVDAFGGVGRKPQASTATPPGRQMYAQVRLLSYPACSKA